MTTLRILAVEVNAILRDYVQVHDDIFGFSLRKLIPIPGLFRAIKYCRHQESLGDLSERLAIIATRDLLDVTPMTPAEAAFLPVFRTYAGALHDTVQRLLHICVQLCRVSQGDSAYRYSNYDADTTAYHASVDTYVSLGNSVNELYGAVRSGA